VNQIKKKKEVTFKKCKTEEHLDKLYQYEVDVFAEAGDFEWSLQNLIDKKENGWDVYSVNMENEEDIVAALFIKKEKGELLTNNTSVKMSHKGLGISHKIKEFFEDTAKNQKVDSIVHFCAVDNFRTITLNENYGYKRVGITHSGEVIKWQKNIS